MEYAKREDLCTLGEALLAVGVNPASCGIDEYDTRRMVKRRERKLALNGDNRFFHYCSGPVLFSFGVYEENARAGYWWATRLTYHAVLSHKSTPNNMHIEVVASA